MRASFVASVGVLSPASPPVTLASRAWRFRSDLFFFANAASLSIPKSTRGIEIQRSSLQPLPACRSQPSRPLDPVGTGRIPINQSGSTTACQQLCQYFSHTPKPLLVSSCSSTTYHLLRSAGALPKGNESRMLVFIDRFNKGT
jgi:hypothetical protein